MLYADTVGLANVVMRIEELQRKHGPDLWAPAPLLKRLAETGETFSQWDKQKETQLSAV